MRRVGTCAECPACGVLRKGLCNRCYNRQWAARRRKIDQEYKRAWYEAHRDLTKKRAREWYTAHKAEVLASRKRNREERASEIKAQKKEYYKKNRERIRARHRASDLKRFYGISSEEYGILLMKQQYRCAIAGCEVVHNDSNGHRLVVDHDHATGAVRGLLCRNHNTGIGLIGDSHSAALAIVSYLKPC